jgi:hypothetical protein
MGMAAETAPAQVPRAVRVGRPVRAARHPGEELAAEAVALPAARAAVRTSRRDRAEAVPAMRSRAKGMTAPTASPPAQGPALTRPVQAPRYPRSKLAAQVVQVEAARLQIAGTEGMMATAPPSRAVRMGRVLPTARPVRVARAVPAARSPGMELSAEASPRSQAEAAAFPASQTEAEQEAAEDSPASRRVRAEAVAVEVGRFPVA